MIHPYDCAAAADDRARELRDREPPAMCTCEVWAAPHMTVSDQLISTAALSAVLAVAGLPLAALAAMSLIVKCNGTKWR